MNDERFEYFSQNKKNDITTTDIVFKKPVDSDQIKIITDNEEENEINIDSKSSNKYNKNQPFTGREMLYYLANVDINAIFFDGRSTTVYNGRPFMRKFPDNTFMPGLYSIPSGIMTFIDEIMVKKERGIYSENYPLEHFYDTTWFLLTIKSHCITNHCVFFPTDIIVWDFSVKNIWKDIDNGEFFINPIKHTVKSTSL